MSNTEAKVAARALVKIWGDRQTAWASAYATAEQAERYAEDCESKGNTSGSDYWYSAASRARAIVTAVNALAGAYA